MNRIDPNYLPLQIKQIIIPALILRRGKGLARRSFFSSVNWTIDVIIIHKISTDAALQTIKKERIDSLSVIARTWARFNESAV